jgi:hypothetical protein
MVPSAFVPLEALPLTPNGKVDRHALPLPDRDRPRLEAVYVAPRSAVEEVLTGIWTEVLGLKQIGIHDNFFELGGHSLLGTQLVARVCDALQVQLPLRCLFDAPTVAGMAAAILQDADQRPLVERAAHLLQALAQLSEEEVETLLMKRLTNPEVSWPG